jgi:hypothetical protein
MGWKKQSAILRRQQLIESLLELIRDVEKIEGERD